MAEVKIELDRLTVDTESVASYLSESTRWLTAYEISMLTGVELSKTKEVLSWLRKKQFALVRKRTYGFENGENEYHSTSVRTLRRRALASSRANHMDVAGIEPLPKRLRRILGAANARKFAKYLR